MDDPGNEAERGPQREPDRLMAEDSAGKLLDRLASFERRLDQVERITTGFDQRLQAVETLLPIAVPPRSIPSVIQAIAPAAPLPDAANAPLPAPSSVRNDAAATPAQDTRPLVRERVPLQPLLGPVPELPAPAPRPAAGVRRRPVISLDELERAVSGRGLAWTGGLTLLLGSLFFLGLAINRGWIGPETRVALALIAGSVVTVLGDRLMRGNDRVLGPVLVAVGIGIWNLGLVAGTRLYDFMPLWAALLGAGAGAAVATAVALRANAQVIALYGTMTALAAPLLFAVPGARTPIAYLLVVLIGSTVIAIARGWSWLPPVAFVVSEVQFYGWWFSADPPAVALILTISGLTLMHLVAATGIERWAGTSLSRATASMLLIFNAVSFASTGAESLSDNRIALTSFLLAGVLAHAAVGWFTLERARTATAFLHVALGIAVTLLTISVPVYFHGAWITVAWAAEAVALIWLATRSRIVAGYPVAIIVFSLAISQYFAQIYGPGPFRTAAQSNWGIPFANTEGLVLLVFLAMLALTMMMLREQWMRVTIAVVGFGLLTAALPAQVSGLPLLAGWSLLAVLALVAERRLVPAPSTVSRGGYRATWATNGLKLAAVVAAALAVERAVVFEMPVLSAVPMEDGAPYLGQPVAATIVIILAALAALAVSRTIAVRQIAGSLAILITAHLAAFELESSLAVATWAGLAVGAIVLQQRRPGTWPVFLATGLLLLAIGLAVTVGDLVPPGRLLVSRSEEISHPFLWSDATLALGALSAAFFAAGWTMRVRTAGTWFQLGSGVLAIYLLSVGIVDEFQGRVSGPNSVTELRRQSQVALSVSWAVLGGLAVAAGLARSLVALRWFGLGLLTLATGKVFLYDLASLDAIYRVLSFMVLGILLLLSSYAYRRLGARPADGDTARAEYSALSNDSDGGQNHPGNESEVATPPAEPIG